MVLACIILQHLLFCLQTEEETLALLVLQLPGFVLALNELVQPGESKRKLCVFKGLLI